jgi:hypothetical protein
VTNMSTEGTKVSSRAYSAWIAKPVILVVVVRQCRVPVPCSIVSESAAAVRIRVSPGWEVDFPKDSILAVEEDRVALDSRVN